MRRLAPLPLLCLVLLASCTPQPPLPAIREPRGMANPPGDRPDIPALSLAGLPNGTVIFWKGGNTAGPIYRHTGSDLAHAAIVLYDIDLHKPTYGTMLGKTAYVYEAVPPEVRVVPFEQYKKEMEERCKHLRRKDHNFAWFLMKPKENYSFGQAAAMKLHADSQVGRPYMIRGWWKGHEVRGIFCSELVGDIIEMSGKIKSGHTHESPGSLHDKLVPFYRELVKP